MLIQSYWGGAEGGAERQCRKQAHALAALGHDITILTRWPGFFVPLRQADESIKIIRVGLFEPVWIWVMWLRSKLLSASFQQKKEEEHALRGGPHKEVASQKKGVLYPLRVFVEVFFILGVWCWVRRRRQSIDVLHIHESHWIAGVGAWLGKKYNILVVSKVATFPALPLITSAVPFRSKWESERKYANYIALNDALRKELLQEGIQEAKITIIPNGVDIPDRIVKSNENLNVLFIGNFSQGRSKGFDVLFAAWEKIFRDFPKRRLVLLGGGDPTYWQQTVQEHGMEDAVEFIGFTTDIERHILDSALLVLPSRFEGMSNALLEAMSYGLPPVVSDILANTELVSDGVNGRVVPVEDPDRLASAISELLSSAEERKRLGAAARATVEEKYALPRVVDRILSLYKTLLVTRI